MKNPHDTNPRLLTDTKFKFVWPFLCMTLLSPSGWLFGQEQNNEKKEQDIISLAPFTVTGSTASGYAPASTMSATRTDTKLLDLPHSVQIVTMEQIKDMGVDQIGEAARYISNTDTRDTDGDSISIRGFSSGTPLIDGVLGASVLTNDLQSIFVERVEVIKGASAVLYGSAQPGGLINLVTVKPLTTPYNMISLGVGSDNYKKVEFDSSGPLNTSKTLRYRVSGSYLNKGNPLLGALPDTIRWGVMPQLYFSPWKGTELLFQVSHEKWEGTPSGTVPIPYWNPATKSPWNLPRNWYRGETRDFMNVERDLISATWIQTFNDNWHLKFNGLGLDMSGIQEWAYTRGAPGDPNALVRNFRHLERPIKAYNGQVDLVGRFMTGPIEHQLLLGGQLHYQDRGDEYTDRYYPQFPIVSPTYGNTLYSGQAGLNQLISEGRVSASKAYVSTANFGGVSDLYGEGLGVIGEVMSFVRDRETKSETRAFYWQDVATLFDNKLHLTVGGRWDYFHQTQIDHGRPTGHPLGKTNDGLSDEDTLEYFPRYAALYKVTPSVSAFALYSESMIPSLGREPTTGQEFLPEIGEQTEGGFKWSMLDGRLNGSVSYFQIVKTNIKETDSVKFITVQQGEATAKGFEVDLHFQVTRDFQFLAGYSTLDQEVTDSQAQQYQGNDEFIVQSPVGSAITNIPESTGYFWGKYSVGDGPLKGLKFALGATRHGKRYIEANRSLALPTATVWDGMISYQFSGSMDNLEAQLNVSNMADKEYWTQGAGTFGSRGPYRTIRFRLSYLF